jgi:hypothetical protein
VEVEAHRYAAYQKEELLREEIGPPDLAPRR